MLKKIKILFNCKLMGSHNWTCNAMEDIPATKEQLENGISGFWDYAHMYCKDCGKKAKIRIQR